MSNETRVAMIRETRRQFLRDAQAGIHLAQQGRATVRTDMAPVKRASNRAPPQPCKFDLNRCTLCLHKADSLSCA
jgi:hypothetical protein